MDKETKKKFIMLIEAGLFFGVLSKRDLDQARYNANKKRESDIFFRLRGFEINSRK